MINTFLSLTEELFQTQPLKSCKRLWGSGRVFELQVVDTYVCSNFSLHAFPQGKISVELLENCF